MRFHQQCVPLLLLWVGCTQSGRVHHNEPPDVQAAEAIPAFLDADYRERWPTRADVNGRPQWRLTDNEPWRVGSQMPFSEQLVVVEQSENALHVVAEWHGIRVALWIPSGDFEPRVIRRSQLGVGRVVFPGAALERGMIIPGDSIRVRFSEGNVDVVGNLKRAHAGVVYTPPDVHRPAMAPSVNGPVSIYGRATNELIASIGADAECWLESIDDALNDGKLRVVVRTEHLEVTGWMNPTHIGPEQLAPLSTRGRGSSSATDAIPVILSAGTVLKHTESKAVVGVTTQETDVMGIVNPGTTVTIREHLPWGVLVVEVECPKLVSSETGWHCLS